MNTRPRSLVTSLAAAVLATATAAQAPSDFDGHIIVASIKLPGFPSTRNPLPGDGGLFLVHPVTGAVTTVQGLSVELTGRGNTTTPQGANCVVRRPSDGALLVGEVAPYPDTLDLHVITLNGSRVQTTRKFTIGSVPFGAGSIDGIAPLPNGDIIVNYQNAMLRNARQTGLAVVSPSRNTVTLHPAGFQGFPVNALAIDHGGNTLYVGLHYGQNANGQIMALSPPLSSTARSLTTALQGVLAMAVDNDNRLVVGTNFNSTTSGLVLVDPVTGRTSSLGSTSYVNGLAVEKATGDLIVYAESRTSTPPYSGIARRKPNGTPQLLSRGPAGGWALVSGIDIDHNPESAGPDSPGLNRYRWATHPNPGGLPTVGNASFSLTVHASPGFGTTASMLFLSNTTAQIPLPPITLLLGGTLSGPHTMPNPKPTATLALPIPNNPALRGIPALYVQSLHLESRRLAASNRLRLKIL